MPEYIGEKCIICDKKFIDKEDIVVCPDCGTPYHRECYAKEGKCINEPLHSSGGSWKEEKMKAIEAELQNSANKDSNLLKCPNCNNLNPKTSYFCSQCGNPINNPANQHNIPNMSDYHSNNSQNINNRIQGNTIFNIQGVNININDKYCGLNPDEDFDGVKLSEIADYVGFNQIYYIPMFKKMKDSGKKLFLNFTCAFFPQYFFANRKCYLLSILSVIFMIFVGIPSTLEALSTTNMFENIFTTLSTSSTAFKNTVLITTFITYVFRVLASLFGNWLYYKHTIKKIKAIKSRNEFSQAEAEEIKTSGGVRPLNIVFIIIVELFLNMAMLYILKII